MIDYKQMTDSELQAVYKQADSDYLMNEMRDSGWSDEVSRVASERRRDAEKELNQRGFIISRDAHYQAIFEKAPFKTNAIESRTMNQISQFFGSK